MTQEQNELVSSTESPAVIPGKSSADSKLIQLLAADVLDFGTLARHCRKGCSSESRPYVWKIMMGVYPLERRTWNGIKELAYREYTDILMTVCNTDDLENPIPDDETSSAIDLDVPRTMSTLQFYRHQGNLQETTPASTFSDTQNCLRRILYTIAKVNKGYGYVQGMNELIAHIVYAFSQGRISLLNRATEAESFFCFQTLFSYLGDDFCRSLDDDHDAGVTCTVRTFDKALQFFDIQLFDHLQSLEVYSEQYAMRWIMLLFTQDFNISDSMRIWDFLLSFGDQIRYVAILVAVAMCHNQRSNILSLNMLSDVVPVLLNYPSGDVNDFLRIAARWIVRFDLPFVEDLRKSTVDQLASLRREHGLEPKGGITSSVQGWIQSLVGQR